MQSLDFYNEQVISYSDQVKPISDGYILSGTNVSLEFKTPPKDYYRHGWHSWSLTTWQDINFQLPVPKPEILHPLQTDPLYVKHTAPNGSWLGAVRFSNGKVLLLGALGLDSHVALHGQQLHGWYEAGRGDWFVSYGMEHTVFSRYSELLSEHFGKAPGKPNPRVWCSWYSLSTAIDEPILHRIFDQLGNLPFDVLQVDDGWQTAIGDWEANEKFSSGMEVLAGKIRASGRTPGLWLAPLLVVPSSSLYSQHPDWLLRNTDGELVSAGHLWAEQLFTLDTTHPEVLNWLSSLMKQVRSWGFDYLKLDFLYAGALPGKRHVDMPREAAYRRGLQVMRKAMGADAYFLTCGAPIIPSIGLCDAIRVGPDVSGTWESYRDSVLLYNPTIPGTKNAIRTTVNRLWLSPLVATDPDVSYFRSKHIAMNDRRKELLQDLALVCNFKATSDLPQWLTNEEREYLHKFLEMKPDIQKTGKYTYAIDGREVDFSEALSLPGPSRGFVALVSAILGWVGNFSFVLKVLNKLGKQAAEKVKKDL